MSNITLSSLRSHNVLRLYIPLALLWVFLALFHLRPARLASGYVYGGDDYGYLAHLSTWLIDGDLDYFNDLEGPVKRNQFPKNHADNYAVGSAYLAAPFYWIGLQCDRVGQRRFSSLKAERNYKNTWTIVFYLLGQQLLAVLGIWFLSLCMREELQLSITSSFIGLAGVLVSFLAVYIFRRPMAHAAEFFISSLWLYYFVHHTRRDQWTNATIMVWGLLSGLALTIRWNDIQFLAFGVLFIAVLQFVKSRAGTGVNWIILIRHEILFMVIAITAFLGLQGYNWQRIYGTFYPGLNRLYHAQAHEAVFHAVHRNSWLFIPHFLVGLDWGILWTGAIVPLGLACLILWPGISRRKISGMKFPDILWVGLVFLLYGVPIAVIVQAMSQGGYYAYRHLTGALAISAILLATVADDFFNIIRLGITTGLKGFVSGLLALSFGLNFLFAIPFEGNSSTLTLSPFMNHFGIFDWNNEAYISNAARALLHPFTYIRSLMAGPLGSFPGWYLSRQTVPASSAFYPLYVKYVEFASDPYYLFMSTLLLTLIAPFLFIILGILRERRKLKTDSILV
jgi:hypothetical protein